MIHWVNDLSILVYMKMEKVTMWVAYQSSSNFMIICPVLKNGKYFNNLWYFLLKWILRFKCQFLHMGLFNGNYVVKMSFRRQKFYMLTSNGIVTWSFGSRSIAAFIATLALEFPKRKNQRVFHRLLIGCIPRNFKKICFSPKCTNFEEKLQDW